MNLKRNSEHLWYLKGISYDAEQKAELPVGAFFLIIYSMSSMETVLGTSLREILPQGVSLTLTSHIQPVILKTTP